MFSFIKKLFSKDGEDGSLLKRELNTYKKALREAQDDLHEKQNIIERMKADYGRLDNNFDAEKKNVTEDYKIEIYNSVSQLLINYPKAIQSVTLNHDLKAKDMMGMLKPIDKLIQTLGIEKIGEIGEIIDYKPSEHEYQGDSNFEVGEKVRIQFLGYRMGDKVLTKAQVEKDRV